MNKTNRNYSKLQIKQRLT